MVYDFVKEYESVPYAAHLKWGPIQVRHHICYRTCIVVHVPVTDIAGRFPLNFFNLKFLLLCVWVLKGSLRGPKPIPVDTFLSNYV